MFDVWMGDTELTVVILILSIAVFLPIQLLLNFKIKCKTVRLLPVIVLSISTIIFFFMGITSAAWDSLGYKFLALFTGLMLLMCGTGWSIWAVAKFVKKKKDNNRTAG